MKVLCRRSFVDKDDVFDVRAVLSSDHHVIRDWKSELRIIRITCTTMQAVIGQISAGGEIGQLSKIIRIEQPWLK